MDWFLLRNHLEVGYFGTETKALALETGLRKNTTTVLREQTTIVRTRKAVDRLWKRKHIHTNEGKDSLALKTGRTKKIEKAGRTKMLATEIAIVGMTKETAKKKTVAAKATTG